MGRLTLENVFGGESERVVDIVRPRPRKVRLPAWALAPALVAVLLVVARGQGVLQGIEWIEWGGLAAGALGISIFAARLEERIYSALSDIPGVVRLVIVALVLAAGIGIAAIFASALGQLPWVARRLALLPMAFALWMASAAFGSVIILLIDIVLLTFVSDFRRRIVVAVLSLITLAFAFCGYIAAAIPELVLAHASGRTLEAERFLGSVAQDLPLVTSLLTRPAAFATWGFVGAALITLPAIFSVCTKLAGNVTERITPLVKAFDRLAEGDRSVHLEEAGSQEFFSLSCSFNEMVDKLYLSERIERAFGQYVSNQVLDRIRAQRGVVRLPAELRTASVFFADIRGFTPISERLAPEAVVDLLNRYFEQVVPVVEQYQGFLNKFVGDAVVVVFNGPIDQHDHAERATACAIAVQQLVAQLNERGVFAEVGQLQIGIGVATGPMLCGNIGTKSRLEYTVIGDTVNLASRMTGQAHGGEVWVSEATAQRLPPSMPAVPFAPIKFKGKDNAVVPYCVWPMQATMGQVGQG